MTDLRTAAQQALTILEAWKHKGMWGDWDGVTDALKAALVEDAMQKFTDVNQELEAALAEPTPLEDVVTHGSAWSKDGKRIDPMSVYAEPVQQPVGVLRTLVQIHPDGTETWREDPMWIAPPQRKPLTEKEIDSIWDSEKAFADIYAIVRAIERAHGIT